jgi:GNAT superfamily N-acetyltransferase
MAASPFVRPARDDDLDAIVDFNVRLALETEGKTLDPLVLTAGARQALADPDRLRYWMAEVADNVVGQAAVTREWSDWRNGWLWWLQSVYVTEIHRGTGVFRALYRQIRDEAFALHDVIGLRLYVAEKNVAAQMTYEALGMTRGGYCVLEELWPERFGRAL